MLIWGKLILLRKIGYIIRVPEPGVMEIYADDEIMGIVIRGKDYMIPIRDPEKEREKFGYLDVRKIFLKDLDKYEIPYLGDGSDLSIEIEIQKYIADNDRQQLDGFDIADVSGIVIPEEMILQ